MVLFFIPKHPPGHHGQTPNTNHHHTKTNPKPEDPATGPSPSPPSSPVWNENPPNDDIIPACSRHRSLRIRHDQGRRPRINLPGRINHTRSSAAARIRCRRDPALFSFLTARTRQSQIKRLPACRFRTLTQQHLRTPGTAKLTDDCRTTTDRPMQQSLYLGVTATAHYGTADACLSDVCMSEQGTQVPVYVTWTTISKHHQLALWCCFCRWQTAYSSLAD